MTFAARSAVLLAAAFAGSATAQEKDYFPAKEGMMWAFVGKSAGGPRPLVFKITKAEKTKDGLRVERAYSTDLEKWGEPDVFLVTAGGVSKLILKDGKPVGDPLVLLKYPLKEGETWSGKITDGNEKGTFTGTVGKAEQVKVKTGTYDAIPVTMEGKGEKEGMGSRMTMWYAAGVGVVKMTFRVGGEDIVMELEAFDQPK